MTLFILKTIIESSFLSTFENRHRQTNTHLKHKQKHTYTHTHTHTRTHTDTRTNTHKHKPRRQSKTFFWTFETFPTERKASWHKKLFLKNIWMKEKSFLFIFQFHFFSCYVFFPFILSLFLFIKISRFGLFEKIISYSGSLTCISACERLDYTNKLYSESKFQHTFG